MFNGRLQETKSSNRICGAKPTLATMLPRTYPPRPGSGSGGPDPPAPGPVRRGIPQALPRALLPRGTLASPQQLARTRSLSRPPTRTPTRQSSFMKVTPFVAPASGSNAPAKTRKTTPQEQGLMPSSAWPNRTVPADMKSNSFPPVSRAIGNHSSSSTPTNQELKQDEKGKQEQTGQIYSRSKVTFSRHARPQQHQPEGKTFVEHEMQLQHSLPARPPSPRPRATPKPSIASKPFHLLPRPASSNPIPALTATRATRSTLAAAAARVTPQVKNIEIHGTSKSNLAQIIGKRAHQEDRIVQAISPDGNWVFLGVFDGHGGDTISRLLAGDWPKSKIPSLSHYLFGQLCTSSTIPQESKISPLLETAFVEYDRLLHEGYGKEGVHCGSTACIALLSWHHNILWLVNLGDSKGVMYDHVTGRSLLESQMHKPNHVEEKARIVSRSGFVSYSEGAFRLGDDLAMSRAFGDFHLKKGGRSRAYDPVQGQLNAIPTISCLRFSQHAQVSKFVLVLASDGVWDSLRPAQIGYLLSRSPATESIGSFILSKTKKAKRWQGDNSSVIVAKLDVSLPAPGSG